MPEYPGQKIYPGRTRGAVKPEPPPPPEPTPEPKPLPKPEPPPLAEPKPVPPPPTKPPELKVPEGTTLAEFKKEEGLVTVAPIYAEKHPEAVVKVGEHFYRPALSATEVRRYKREGLSKPEMYAQKLAVKKEVVLAPPELPLALPLDKEARREAILIARMPLLKQVEHYVGTELMGARPDIIYQKLINVNAPLEVRLAYAQAVPRGLPRRQLEPLYEEAQKDFEEKHIQLKDEKWLPKADFYGLPLELRNIGLQEGYDAMVRAVRTAQREFDVAEREFKEFKKDNVIIGNWSMLVDEWNTLPEEYQTIALRQGFPVMTKQIEADKIRQDTIIATLDKKYQVDGGYNLPLALKDKAITDKDLEFVGFEKKDVDNAVSTVKASIATNVAVAGERNWLDIRTHKTYTDIERLALIKESPQKQDELVLDPASGRRLGLQVVSFIAPATRVALPEVTIKDISAVEWGLTGVNTALIGTALAPGAILGSLAGKVVITGVSTTGSGLLFYHTVSNWSELPTGYKAIGVAGTLLYALPMLGIVARGVKFSKVAIPAWEKTATPGVRIAGFTGEGVPLNPVAWKGLSIANNPIIGRSGGKWVIGARNITIPEARLILEGYHPTAMLDTKVFVNPKALSKAGFSQTQIDYLTSSLKFRNLFAGKKSPFLAKEALLEPTSYLDADEAQVLVRQIIKHNKMIKQADVIYGSAAIKTQLAPGLKNWRQIHDWDIQTLVGREKTLAFLQDTIRELRKLPGRVYRVNPKYEALIEKRIGGEWKHIADIHSEEVMTGLSSKKIPGFEMEGTGDYSYGRMVAEPAITIKYPGIGKVDIMALSESGVRKADTILRVRQTEAGIAFRPPQRGIARPGVPKDAADYYVILQTYEQAGILRAGTSEAWLKSWAKAMGYTEAQLAKLMPNLKKVAIEVASKTPSNLIGYRFTPASTTKVSPGASPTITIQVPSSLGASVSASLAKRISTPVSLYALSPKARASISATVSKVVPSGYPTMVSSTTMRGLSPSAKANVSASVQRVSPKVSPSPSPKPSPKPSPSPVISPRPSPKPSPVPSPKPSPKPSPVPSPAPVPAPTPTPTPVPGKPPPPVLTRLQTQSPISQPIPAGSIAWAQGMRKGVRGLMVSQWYFIPPPYDMDKPISLSAPPLGAINTDSASPYDTIQVIGRPRVAVPSRADVDLGWADIYVLNGREIKFKAGGERTNIGTRIVSTTKGMAIPGGEDLIPGTPASVRGISRPAMSKKKPKRKSKREDDYSAITSVRGVRF